MSPAKSTVDRKWFERRLAELNISSWTEFARRVGVSKSQISLVLDGKRHAHIDLVREMSRVLRAPLHELARKLGGPVMEAIDAVAEIERGSTLELAGTIGGDFSVVFTPETRTRKLVHLGIEAPTGSQALEYQTAGTPAAMFHGSLAVIQPRQEADEDTMAGRHNVVWLSDGRVLMRMVEASTDAGRYKLTAAGCDDIIDAEITHFAPVLAIMAN